MPRLASVLGARRCLLRNSQLGNSQIAQNPDGNATVVLYPDTATQDQIDQIAAVVEANGWNLLKSGTQTDLAPEPELGERAQRQRGDPGRAVPAVDGSVVAAATEPARRSGRHIIDTYQATMGDSYTRPGMIELVRWLDQVGDHDGAARLHRALGHKPIDGRIASNPDAVELPETVEARTLPADAVLDALAIGELAHQLLARVRADRLGARTLDTGRDES